ncbi:hypothetical protein XA3_18560 [Xylocopilactobacillus apicola]|uniref:Uncharacterized protein n=1 Tax=Xylocopilactobacillus apicola TaxID=2932184 RepID=A0AAU9DHE7_9LACO|nr:hypothetical protein XA3_18560 [Xylocopilactobacillus apicola]
MLCNYRECVTQATVENLLKGAFSPLSEQELLKQLKTNYPDSWKFLESLRQNKNDMIHENK